MRHATTCRGQITQEKPLACIRLINAAVSSCIGACCERDDSDGGKDELPPPVHSSEISLLLQRQDAMSAFMDRRLERAIASTGTLRAEWKQKRVGTCLGPP